MFLFCIQAQERTRDAGPFVSPSACGSSSSSPAATAAARAARKSSLFTPGRCTRSRGRSVTASTSTKTREPTAVMGTEESTAGKSASSSPSSPAMRSSYVPDAAPLPRVPAPAKTAVTASPTVTKAAPPLRGQPAARTDEATSGEGTACCKGDAGTAAEADAADAAAAAACPRNGCGRPTPRACLSPAGAAAGCGSATASRSNVKPLLIGSAK